MPNPVKWDAPQAYTLLIAGDASSPTLKNLANGGQVLGGTEIDGETDLWMFADFKLRFRSTTPTAGAAADLYLVLDLDGNEYQDGDASIIPPDSAWVAGFVARAVTTQQVVVVRGIVLPPFKWKPVLINRFGSTLTNTNDENQLYYRPYSPEIT